MSGVKPGIKDFRKSRPAGMSSREADRVWSECASKTAYRSTSEIDWRLQKNRRAYRCSRCGLYHLTKKEPQQ